MSGTPTQAAIAGLLVQMLRLLDVLGLEMSNDLTLNYHGPLRRLDIAKVDADGHMGAILASLDADLTSPTFGESVGLPWSEVCSTTH